jgi:hypothetical protein
MSGPKLVQCVNPSRARRRRGAREAHTRHASRRATNDDGTFLEVVRTAILEFINELPDAFHHTVVV